MTAPVETTAATFTTDQLERLDHHIRDLHREIDEKCTEQREVVGHALARIAQTVHPGTQHVRIYGIQLDGQFGRIVCDVAGNPEDLPVGPQVTAVLTAILRRLPTGTTGVWRRDALTVTVDVTAAPDLGDRYPFLQVQDRLMAYLEEKTGRAIRSIEIGTDLWDDGYFFNNTVEVDYSDGDRESVYVDNMNDFSLELRYEVGDPGPHTSVSINRTSAGITID